MDEDVDMEQDDEDNQQMADGDVEDIELEPESLIVEIKPPDATAPIKIRKDYTPKGKRQYSMQGFLCKLLIFYLTCFKKFSVRSQDSIRKTYANMPTV